MTISQTIKALIEEDTLLAEEVNVPVHLALGRALAAPIPGLADFEPGLTLKPAHLALLAEAGCQEILTFQPAGIGLVSLDAALTGNETEAAAVVAPANIALAAAASEAGQLPIDMGVVPDHAELHRAALERALTMAEIVCSVGPSPEQMRELNDALGGESRLLVSGEGGFTFLSVTLLEDGVWFGLPGGPAEALAAFQLFVLPWAKKIAGHRAFAWPTIECSLTEPLSIANDFAWVWARLDRTAGNVATPLHPLGKPNLAAAAQADGLLTLTPSAGSSASQNNATLIVTR